jgi:hypothetical protein
VASYPAGYRPRIGSGCSEITSRSSALSTAGRAVGKVRGDDQAAFSIEPHRSNAFIPALDRLAAPELKGPSPAWSNEKRRAERMAKADRLAQQRRRAARQATTAVKRSTRRRAKNAALAAARLALAGAVVSATGGIDGGDGGGWAGDGGGDD